MTVSQTDPDQLRPSDEDSLGPVVRIGPARREEAIARLVGTGLASDGAAAERFLHYARTNAIRLDGLWARLDDRGRVAYSVLAVPSPGRTAMFFASHPRSGGRVAVVAGLIDHACAELTGWEVHMAQALLEPGETLQRQTFLGAGFKELALLSYLERPLSKRQPCEPPDWPPGATVQRYRDDLYDELAAVLEQSYQQTLDCPGLYGLRRTRDIITGHMATGKFDPSLWTLLRIEGQGVGAILLNPFPDHKTIELVYIGLAPSARKRGLGKRLLQHGLWLLNDRRERSVTLAVDERNPPALSLYESEGFRPVVQRVAMIRRLEASTPEA